LQSDNVSRPLNPHRRRDRHGTALRADFGAAVGRGSVGDAGKHFTALIYFLEQRNLLQHHQHYLRRINRHP
jgi:hypothetical protein